MYGLSENDYESSPTAAIFIAVVFVIVILAVVIAALAAVITQVMEVL